jgi:hypothetical protein
MVGPRAKPRILAWSEVVIMELLDRQRLRRWRHLHGRGGRFFTGSSLLVTVKMCLCSRCFLRVAEATSTGGVVAVNVGASLEGADGVGRTISWLRYVPATLKVPCSADCWSFVVRRMTLRGRTAEESPFPVSKPAGIAKAVVETAGGRFVGEAGEEVTTGRGRNMVGGRCTGTVGGGCSGTLGPVVMSRRVGGCSTGTLGPVVMSRRVGGCSTGTLVVVGDLTVREDDDGLPGLQPEKLFLRVWVVRRHGCLLGASPGDTSGSWYGFIVWAWFGTLGTGVKKRILRSVTVPDGSITL